MNSLHNDTNKLIIEILFRREIPFLIKIFASVKNNVKTIFLGSIVVRLPVL